jgi:hypothetical protein
MKTLTECLLLVLLVDGIGYAALPELRHLANKQATELFTELNANLDSFDATLASPAAATDESELMCYEETITGEATVAQLGSMTMIIDAPTFVFTHD